MSRIDIADMVETGPNTPAGRLMRRFWQPIEVAADLQPGRPHRIKVLGEHFTLFRGESGRAHLVADRCPHRGTQLSLGWVEGDCIRCFYHGWIFDGAGRCVEQPAEKESFARKVQIASYPVEEALGLVFAYLGPDEPPPLPRFPELEDDPGDRIGVRRVQVPCNYFQRIENDIDETHIHFVHRAATEASGLRALPDKIDARETDYGLIRETLRTEQGVEVVTYAHFFMPNTIMVKIAPDVGGDRWPTLLAWRIPVDLQNTMSLIVTRFPEARRGRRSAAGAQGPDPHLLTEAILASEARIQDVEPSYRHAFTVQDNVVLKGQGRVYLRENEHLGKSDAPVIMLRKLWERELRALTEGRPLKAWRRPAEPLELGVEADVQIANAAAGTAGSESTAS